MDTTEVRNRMLMGKDAVTPSPKKEEGVAGRVEDLASPAPSAAPREAKVLTTPEQASIDALTRRLESAEVQLAAARVAPDQGLASILEASLAKQNELLEKVSSGPRRPTSTIRVEPRVTWPHLGDDGPGGKEADDFSKSWRRYFRSLPTGKVCQTQSV